MINTKGVAFCVTPLRHFDTCKSRTCCNGSTLLEICRTAAIREIHARRLWEHRTHSSAFSVIENTARARL
jgi:hypothetical protein